MSVVVIFNMRKLLSKRYRKERLFVFMMIFIGGYTFLWWSFLQGKGNETSLNLNKNLKKERRLRNFTFAPDSFENINKESYLQNDKAWKNVILQPSIHTEFVPKDAFHFHVRGLLSNHSEGSHYPPDIPLEVRRDGAIILHVIGMAYMFIALAIVCDEFFVPSLGVITEYLEISEDVAGATFMAAGGSAPELFTSLIGVFIASSEVGIATIVGSAVFNILFVIGTCALFSKEVLQLTWWPLFRDATFYSISLLLLIYFFHDDNIYWWEALILFLWYAAYVVFMKFNQTIELKTKKLIFRMQGTNKVVSADEIIEDVPPPSRGRLFSIPVLHSGAGHYRHGVVQLMIHSANPTLEADHVQRLTEARRHSSFSRKLSNPDMPKGQSIGGSQQQYASQLPTTAELSSSGSSEGKTTFSLSNINQPSNIRLEQEGETNVNVKVISNGKIFYSTLSSQINASSLKNNAEPTSIDQQTCLDTDLCVNHSTMHASNESSKELEDSYRAQLNSEEPLDLSWPQGWQKRINYILVAPIVFSLWISMPDVRRPEKKKYFPISFCVSILWIAGYSYLMVWWANQVGETIGIEDEVMGLTILAAGTSIPDLITSVIVAKKGFGDMAVSSSVGSNIFDITVGLPVPWALYGIIFSGQPYVVSSKGLFCSIIMLFMMLIVVIVSIAVSKWRMSKLLGLAMMGLYLVFVTLSVLLEIDVIKCIA